MSKRLFLVVGLVFATAAPLAAHAYGGVTVAVSTPEFGFRIGAPPYRPYYAPAPVYLPTPVYPSVVYAPPPVVYAAAPVLIPAPRLVYPAPVMVAPRVVYPRAYLPAPRVVVPHDDHYYGYRQQTGYWVPPGHAKRHSQNVRYQ
jgi:hypothetical protein